MSTWLLLDLTYDLLLIFLVCHILACLVVYLLSTHAGYSERESEPRRCMICVYENEETVANARNENERKSNVCMYG